MHAIFFLNRCVHVIFYCLRFLTLLVAKVKKNVSLTRKSVGDLCGCESASTPSNNNNRNKKISEHMRTQHYTMYSIVTKSSIVIAMHKCEKKKVLVEKEDETHYTIVYFVGKIPTSCHLPMKIITSLSK